MTLLFINSLLEIQRVIKDEKIDLKSKDVLKGLRKLTIRGRVPKPFVHLLRGLVGPNIKVTVERSHERKMSETHA